MDPVPVRLPETLAAAVDRVAAREGVDRSTALRRLLAAGLDRYVADLYRRGDISLREAAAWLDLPVRLALDRLSDLGVTGNVTSGDVQAALEAAREMKP